MKLEEGPATPTHLAVSESPRSQWIVSVGHVWKVGAWSCCAAHTEKPRWHSWIQQNPHPVFFSTLDVLCLGPHFCIWGSRIKWITSSGLNYLQWIFHQNTYLQEFQLLSWVHNSIHFIAHPQRLWPLAQLNNALLTFSLWYSLHLDAQGILSRCIITLIKYIKNNKNIQRRDWRNRQAAWSSCPRQGKEFSLAVNRQQQTLTKT